MRSLVAMVVGLMVTSGCGVEMELDECPTCTDERSDSTYEPALTIFLNPEGGSYRATDVPVPTAEPGEKLVLDAYVFGPDVPASNRSSILRLYQVFGASGVAELKPWPHTAGDWQAVTDCVDAVFADFDVAVTDTEPAADVRYVEVAFAENSRQWGTPNGAHGEAPSDSASCEPIDEAIVFVDAVGRWDEDIMLGICEDVAHEVGHVLGLGHVTSEESLMSYKPFQQGRAFSDTDLRCDDGECLRCGVETQNAYQHLMTVLGPAPRPR